VQFAVANRRLTDKLVASSLVTVSLEIVSVGSGKLSRVTLHGKRKLFAGA
jgi:hypothetical protein